MYEGGASLPCCRLGAVWFCFACSVASRRCDTKEAGADFGQRDGKQMVSTVLQVDDGGLAGFFGGQIGCKQFILLPGVDAVTAAVEIQVDFCFQPFRCFAGLQEVSGADDPGTPCLIGFVGDLALLL